MLELRPNVDGLEDVTGVVGNGAGRGSRHEESGFAQVVPKSATIDTIKRDVVDPRHLLLKVPLHVAHGNVSSEVFDQCTFKLLGMLPR